MGKILTEQRSDLADRTADAVVSSKTPLRQLLSSWSEASTPYRLVQDADGIVTGIVDLQYVQQLLESENLVERRRWERMTVGSVADAVFAYGEQQCEAPVAAPNLQTKPGQFIHDAAGRIALMSNGEMYVNWSRVSAALKACHIDPVTQLPTRSSFNRRMQEELDRAARLNQSLAVMLIDLDHLKQINDQYGHSAGDATLRLVADSLREGIRSYDFIARYGGDEFAGTCFDCKPQDILLPIERIRRVLAEQRIPNVDADLRISVSIGIAALHNVAEQCVPELLLEHADECLYLAKRSGRSTSFVVELDSFGIPITAPREIQVDRG